MSYTRKTILYPRHRGGFCLERFSCRIYRPISKIESRYFKEWLDAIYCHTYADVKNGDAFILWNGNNLPVPFIKDATDKHNRPTRLNDGSYLFVDSHARVAIVSNSVITQLKIDINNYKSRNS